MSIDYSLYVPDVSWVKIPIKQLVANQDYQRPLSESQILKAVEEFDLLQINPVKVSRRNGVNYVMDGQHTIEIVAAKSNSRETPVWCMVYDGLKYEREARMFAEQQKHTRNLVPYDTFKAHVESGSHKHLMIRDLVRSYGLEIGSSMGTGVICAAIQLDIYIASALIVVIIGISDGIGKGCDFFRILIGNADAQP